MLRGSRFSRESGDLKTPFLAGKERELLESKKWPACFSKSVDITKVQIEAFKPWITRRVTELMGVEDEIVVDYCLSQLKYFGETDAKANAENAGDGGACLNEKPFLDPKKLQINLTGFMAKNARIFVKELWELLLAAQDNEYGIPQAFIEEKKKEIAAIQQEAKEVDDTLRQMDSMSARDTPATGAVAQPSDTTAVRDGEDSDKGRSPRDRSREVRSVSGSRGKRGSRAWYSKNKYNERRNNRSNVRRRGGSSRSGSLRGRNYRRERGYRRRSISPTPSRSRSGSYDHRPAPRRVSYSRSPSYSGSYRSHSSTPRSSYEASRPSRRRRSYSSASSRSDSSHSPSVDSRHSRSVSRDSRRRHDVRGDAYRDSHHRRRHSPPRRRRDRSHSRSSHGRKRSRSPARHDYKRRRGSHSRSR
ncbi:putative pwi domain-containing protein [Babesia sp. Xinjiang]|uniref:putative pwi domain-containing protein n=1 Tax=Babesia sp. Xinjiang TaxID=462227 RepID=UPI000A24FD12|nr:putative pwi domain-containing protein [Babesia sp. Xinjiang]ORM41914.1 putative pwi domain-containing protein [Babesia sp. Xinjiang]